MKLYFAGLPYGSAGSQAALQYASKRGASNFLFSYGTKNNRADGGYLVRDFLGSCSGCGQALVRVGEHLVCPDKLNELRRKIGEIE